MGGGLRDSQQIGAGLHDRVPGRLTHRNGYRPRRWDTRTGTIDLRIPKLRKGTYLLDALTQKVREGGRLVNIVVVVDTAVNSQGQREVLGLDCGASEDGPRPRRRLMLSPTTTVLLS